MYTEIKLTEDGSSTLYVPEINETYHSTHGAIQESMHIFIQLGLNACPKEHIRILEIGFGTGLNALLTVINSNKTIEYITLEKYPVEPAKFSLLNYPELLKAENTKEIWQNLLFAPWNQMAVITPAFRMQKIQTDFCDFAPSGKFDLIYFDAFSPEKQPEMWELKQFQKLYDAAAPGAILVTYCAKGEVRRNLQASGFTVERLPGPPGKREVLRGTATRNESEIKFSFF